MSMKLKVLILSVHPRLSPVIKDEDSKAMVLVKDLPTGLGRTMENLVRLLVNIGIAEIYYGENDGESVLLVKKNEKYHTSEVIYQPNIRVFLEDTIPLLVWHFSEHFSLSGRLGGTVRCLDCERSQEPPFNPHKCQNHNCPSHQKRIAIDPSYEATTTEEDPVVQRLDKMNEEISGAIKIH